MDAIIKLNEQTAGRDRIIRLLQYGSRAYWYYAQNTSNTRHSAEVLRSLEYTFGSFRKLLRLGRFLDSFYSALKTTKHPDIIVRITLTIAKISNALFLLADHIIWIGRVGILRVNVEKWNKVANRYWLMNIVMNLTRDIYEMVKFIQYHGKGIFQRGANFPEKCNLFQPYGVLAHLKYRKDVTIDTLKNTCDLFIPLTALGFTNFAPGTIGILGIISSVIGLYTLICPLYKLSPP
ncbi:hypothetical protein KM043_003881 [Ampulex compressa]|nr:hypothetical protein KM043_003881 [Ampulex compressa]